MRDQTAYRVWCGWQELSHRFAISDVGGLVLRNHQRSRRRPRRCNHNKRRLLPRQIKTAASNSGSSLDAHREGKAPASGPLKDIYFDFDQYDLRADARDMLKSHAEWLKDNASAQVEIEGHCDERGTGEYNLALGAKRAQTAKDYLGHVGGSG